MIPANAKTLVLERLKNLPGDAKLSIGTGPPVTKAQLVTHVEKMDEIGEDYVEMELFYLRGLVKRYGSK